MYRKKKKIKRINKITHTNNNRYINNSATRNRDKKKQRINVYKTIKFLIYARFRLKHKKKKLGGQFVSPQGDIDPFPRVPAMQGCVTLIPFPKLLMFFKKSSMPSIPDLCIRDLGGIKFILLPVLCLCVLARVKKFPSL